MKNKASTHEELVLAQLKDSGFAAAYLNEHWNYKGPKRLELLMQALHRVALARGISQISKDSGISRRALYKVFSEDGNPTIETLLALLDTFGIGIQFSPHSSKRRKAA